MKQLMIHVERAVRPICAEESTKCRMREEQHAHLIAIYEDELQKMGDDRKAIEKACERFGNPADLTVELQKTVPWIERAIIFPIEAYMHCRKHETALRHSMRLGGTVLLFYAVVSVTTIAIVELLAIAVGHRPTGRLPVDFAIRARVIVAMGSFLVINFGLFTLMGYAMRTQFETGLFRPRSIIATVGMCLMATVTEYFVGLGMLWIALLDPVASFAWQPRWFVVVSVETLVFAVCSRLAAIEFARARPWTTLHIDE